MRTRLFILGLIVLVVLGVLFSYREYQRRQRVATGQRLAAENLREYVKDFQPVRFRAVTGDILTFAWQEQSVRSGETFVDYVEHEALIVNRNDGVVRANAPALAFSDLKQDQEIYVDMIWNATEEVPYSINGVYLLE